eukprot:TRINITY_DN36386_c0_g1_i2.p1 TRINITY_DN36386_c0_g1~~TRINITY_DN36386_c0_g1_i2.p1  ORF type:complete len:187 (+),score=30.88 TRINITY_DN36386_c0_g1_i2:135-695(+)
MCIRDSINAEYGTAIHAKMPSLRLLPLLLTAACAFPSSLSTDSNTTCVRFVRKICARSNGASTVGSFYLQESGTQTPIGFISQAFPGSGFKLRYTSPKYSSPQHVAPNKQFIINLDASVRVRTSEGQQVVFERGELFFVEDTFGVGHFSMAEDETGRHSVFLMVADEYDAGPCVNATKPTDKPLCQ